MPKVPPLRLRLQVLRAERAFQPYLETAFYAPQRRPYTAYRPEIPTPSYVPVNGGLRLRRYARMLTLAVTNLLNARYQSHLSIFRRWGREGIYAPGRSFYVRMEGHL
jgi:outer membrane receptor protein involved in Fe transport